MNIKEKLAALSKKKKGIAVAVILVLLILIIAVSVSCGNNEKDSKAKNEPAVKTAQEEADKKADAEKADTEAEETVVEESYVDETEDTYYEEEYDEEESSYSSSSSSPESSSYEEEEEEPEPEPEPEPTVTVQVPIYEDDTVYWIKDNDGNVIYKSSDPEEWNDELTDCWNNGMQITYGQNGVDIIVGYDTYVWPVSEWEDSWWNGQPDVIVTYN